MRLLFLAAPILALEAPAAAQSYDPRDEKIMRAIPTPDEMAGMSDMLGRIMSAMMDLEIGGLAKAIDPGAPVPQDRTLRDMAGRDDPYFEERMRRSVDAAAANMGDVMTDIAIMTPRLRRTFEDMSRDIEDATRDLPNRR